MPSAYTAAVSDGIDFKTFVLRCARAMGACVSMRDDPLDVPIPERFEPSDYHVRKTLEAEAQLETLRAMSPAEAETAAAAEYAEKVAANDQLSLTNQGGAVMMKVPPPVGHQRQLSDPLVWVHQRLHGARELHWTLWLGRGNHGDEVLACQNQQAADSDGPSKR